MKIAVVGCCHGELDIIYERIADLERQNNYTIDLVLICGDFQAVRNRNDLNCMAVPPKYAQLGTFYHYYLGQKVASKMTLVIGGNHEASNYMQTLPYGGWIAPNMYYLGYASVVNYGGLRIGGLSGIFNHGNNRRGHFECLPYNPSTMRSAYHMRQTDVYKVLQLSPALRPNGKVVDVFLSHDWPINIHECGNADRLFRMKPFFRRDVEEGPGLGNPLMQPLVNHLRATHWFAAHLHVAFNACVRFAPNVETNFQSLDKVLRKRQFLKVFDIEPAVKPEPETPLVLKYDAEWLAILKATDEMLNVDSQPGPDLKLDEAANKVIIKEKDIEEVIKELGGDLTIPTNFQPSDPVPAEDVDLDPQRTTNYRNPQTAALCDKLNIRDPIDVLINENIAPAFDNVLPGKAKNPDEIDLDDGSDCEHEHEEVKNPDEIDLDDKSDQDEEKETDEAKGGVSPASKKSKTGDGMFFIDTKGE